MRRPEVRELADFVARELIAPTANQAEAVAVPKGETRRHEKEIWASIK